MDVDGYHSFIDEYDTHRLRVGGNALLCKLWVLGVYLGTAQVLVQDK